MKLRIVFRDAKLLAAPFVGATSRSCAYSKRGPFFWSEVLGHLSVSWWKGSVCFTSNFYAIEISSVLWDLLDVAVKKTCCAVNLRQKRPQQLKQRLCSFDQEIIAYYWNHEVSIVSNSFSSLCRVWNSPSSLQKRLSELGRNRLLRIHWLTVISPTQVLLLKFYVY